VSRKKASKGSVKRRKRAKERKAGDRRAAQAVRVVTERAIWRLNVLEYVFLAVAGGLSLVAGAVAAFGLQAVAGVSFRSTWAVSSLLFFVIPGAAVLGRERRARRAKNTKAEASLKEHDG
jgi:uncharacterized membrane protein